MKYTEQFRNMVSEKVCTELEPFFTDGYANGNHFFIKSVMACDMGYVPETIYVDDETSVSREFLLKLISISAGALNDDFCTTMGVEYALNKELLIPVMEE